jgi:hypothetical protein
MVIRTGSKAMMGFMMSSPHRRKLAMLFAMILALGVGLAFASGAFA